MVKDNRFVKMYQSVTDHWLWKNSLYYRWWCDLLFMASWKDKTTVFSSSVVRIGRGQLIASVRFLCEKWTEGGWGTKIRRPSKDKVMRFLRLLEEEGMIKRSFNLPRGTTLITIVNYDKYQGYHYDDEEIEDNDIVFSLNDTTDLDVNQDTNTGVPAEAVPQYVDEGKRADAISASLSLNDHAGNDSTISCHTTEHFTTHLSAQACAAQPSPAPNMDDAFFAEYFSKNNEASLTVQLMQLHRVNPSVSEMRHFVQLGVEVLADWKQNHTLHSDYSRWASHFWATIRKKNSYYAKNSSTDRLSDYELARRRGDEALLGVLRRCAADTFT